MSKVIEATLIVAKDMISDPERWAKGDYRIERVDKKTGEKVTCYCAAGAVLTIVGARSVFSGGISTLNDALKDFKPDFAGNVADFNDHPDTTHADVMALFDAAIERASHE